MKKLIPALCMLLVAACLMGTSTYAWFSANTQVTASGMSVKAASDGGLAIASYNNVAGAKTEPDEEDFASSAALNNNDWKYGNSTIKPASFNGTDWVKGAASFAGEYAATSMEDVTNLAEHVQRTTWQLKSLKDGYTAQVAVQSITVTGSSGSATLNKSLRVAIVTDDHIIIFAPLYDESQTGLVYVASYTTTPSLAITTASSLIKAGDGITVNDDDTTTINAWNQTAVVFDDLGTAAEDLDVYVYYEGQDTNCKSANATNIDTLSVSINYFIISETEITGD